MYKMQQNENTGYLEIIIGSMFSGKTSKLLEIYKQCKFCNIPVAVINYDEDKRYHNNMLSTHDQIMIPCIQTDYLDKLWCEPNKNKTDYDKLKENYEIVKNADVILINEGQFFGDLKNIVKDMLKMKKKVYVSGLDGDYMREKFGFILDLIPLCDKVTKLISLCGICKNGTPGIFSLRLTNENIQKVIGNNNYIPVCRNCYESNTIQ
jgi:thymidine kinase